MGEIGGNVRGCSSNVVIAWSVDVKMQLSWRVRVQAYRCHREGAIAKNQPGGCAAGEDSRRGINGDGPAVLEILVLHHPTAAHPTGMAFTAVHVTAARAKPNIAHLYQRRDHQFGFEFSRRGSDLPSAGVFPSFSRLHDVAAFPHKCINCVTFSRPRLLHRHTLTSRLAASRLCPPPAVPLENASSQLKCHTLTLTGLQTHQSNLTIARVTVVHS